MLVSDAEALREHAGEGLTYKPGRRRMAPYGKRGRKGLSQAQRAVCAKALGLKQ